MQFNKPFANSKALLFAFWFVYFQIYLLSPLFAQVATYSTIESSTAYSAAESSVESGLLSPMSF